MVSKAGKLSHSALKSSKSDL